MKQLLFLDALTSQRFARFVGLTMMHKHVEMKMQAPGLVGKDRTAVLV